MRGVGSSSQRIQGTSICSFELVLHEVDLLVEVLRITTGKFLQRMLSCADPLGDP